MERSLKNKTVVITGAAQGIGYAIADNYLKNGVKIAIILDRKESGRDAAEQLNTQHGNGRAVFIKCDITKDLDTVSKKILDLYQPVDILVNNAGIFNDSTWKETIDTNTIALIGWSLKFWDHMRTDKGGKGGTILNIASISGYRIDNSMPVYGASKFAVMGFTRALGHEVNFTKSGVRVVALTPSGTKTDINKGEMKHYDDAFFRESLLSFLDSLPWQSADAVGKAAVDAFEIAPSGTAWLIEGGEPISEILQG